MPSATTLLGHARGAHDAPSVDRDTPVTSDDLRAASNAADEARRALERAEESIAGWLEEPSYEDGPNVKVPRLGLVPVAEGLRHALQELERLLDAGYPDTCLETLAAQVEDMPDSDEPPGAADVPSLVVWGLTAGAHPVDLISLGVSAETYDCARTAALYHVIPGAGTLPASAPTAVAPDDVGPAPDPQPETAARPARAKRRPASPPVAEPAPVSPAGAGWVAGPAAPTLERFAQSLRPYQQAAVDDALAFVRAVRALPPEAPEAQRRRLYSCPTGVGKGTAELALLRALLADGLDAWCVTPSLDVLRGFLERCGADEDELAAAGPDRLAELGEGIRVTTPTRLRNRVLSGDRRMPQAILYDEVHHATEGNDVSGTLFALAPLAAWIGWTATPYRGTPKGTQDLEHAWPDQVEVLTVPEAVAGGWWALPTFSVEALVDDDEIKLAGGDFQAKAAGAAVASRIEDLAALVGRLLDGDVDAVAARYSGGVIPAGAPAPWVPTAVTVPSVEVAGLLVESLDRRGITARRVSAETPAPERARAYAECRAGAGVLVSVRVLAEGVDFPWLRRLVDARPTLSPVSWLQQVGRITRPGERRPEYICVCRNLERHAYLLQGLVPRRAVADAQTAFGAPSARSGHRSVGLEALGRFKPIALPLAEGLRGVMHALWAADANGVVTEWVALLDPTSERAVTACRTVAPLPDGSKGYGKWAAAPLPLELTGYATSGFRGKVSEKQKTWWTRAAARHGLDPGAAAADLTQRQFACLPVLSNLRLSMAAQPAEGAE